MQDFLGNDLEVNDSVIFIAPGYRSLVLGRVVKLTEKSIRIAYMNTWNFSKPGYRSELLQRPSQVTKVAGSDLTMYILKNSE